MSTRIIIILALLLVPVPAGFAHTPHHNIDAMEIVASGPAGSSIFIVRGSWQIFRSHNGGESWREVSNGLTARHRYTSLTSLEREARSEIFLATDGDGIYQSSDGGDSWSTSNEGLGERRIAQVIALDGGHDESKSAFAISESGDVYRRNLADERWQPCDLGGRSAESLAVLGEPGNQKVVVGAPDGQFLVSDNAGSSWRAIHVGVDVGGITTVAEVPNSDGLPGETVLVGTSDGGIFRSDDGGASFREANEGLTDRSIRSLKVSPRSNDATILVSTWSEGVFRSSDGGRTWSSSSEGLSTHPQATQPAFYSPQFREIEYSHSGETIFLAGFDGLFKSTDGGLQWQQLQTEPPGNIWSLSATSTNGGDHELALTTFDTGVYRASADSMRWRVANRGLVSRRIRELVFSPAYRDDGLIFAVEDEGDRFLRWEEDEQKWGVLRFEPDLYSRYKVKILAALHHRLGLPEFITTDFISREERVQANPKGLVVSPHFAADGFVFATTRYRGNYVSHDGGKSLERIGTPEYPLWEVAISPGFSEDRTLFASARNHGVFRSRNAGKSWHPINQGLEFLLEWARSFQETEQAVVELGQSMFYDIRLAVSPGFSEDRTLFAGGGEGLYKSIDGGERWIEIGSLTDSYIMALALSPDFGSDDTILVSVKGKGLWISNDQGESFSRFASRLIGNNHEVRHLRFSPTYGQDRTIYVASQEFLFRSRDNGRSWEQVDRLVRYENGMTGYELSGPWQLDRSQNFSAGSAHRLAGADGALTFSFVGTGIDWIGPRSKANLAASIHVDGMSVPESARVTDEGIVASIRGLSPGSHVIRLEPQRAAGGKDARDGLVVDAFDLHGTRRSNVLD